MGRALSTLLFPARLTGHSLGLQRPRTQWATDLSSGKPPSLTGHSPLPPRVLPQGPGWPGVSEHTSLLGDWDLPPVFSSAFPAGSDTGQAETKK